MTSRDLVETLLSAPEGFEIFQAVRVVEDAAACEAKARGLEPPPEIGSHDPGAGVDDPVRFGSAVTLSFPGGAITRAEAAQAEAVSGEAAPALNGSGAVRLEVASFGLLGPSGAMPRHYTVLVLERWRRFRDRAIRDFLDIFTHRATSLLVRAWAKYRATAQRWRLTRQGRGAAWNESPEPRDVVATVIASLLGLGGRSLSGRMDLPESLLLYHAGHLTRQPAAALPLEQVIEDVWGVPVSIDQFVGRWLELPPADQTRLGGPRPANARLGMDALAGRRVWSVEAAYCVRLGPLSWSAFQTWLPGAGQLEALGDLLRFHVGPALEPLIRPVLGAGDVPPLKLGSCGGRLGWTTWLMTARPVRDADDAFFYVEPARPASASI